MTALGAEGRRFESCLPDQKTVEIQGLRDATGGDAVAPSGTSRQLPNRVGTASHGIAPEDVPEAFREPRTLARFLDKIMPMPNGCWDWVAATGAGGYGSFKVSRGVVKQAHRIAYSLYKGDPSGLVVRHTCDRPICCNPEHLRLGTHQDNANDRWKRPSPSPETV